MRVSMTQVDLSQVKHIASFCFTSLYNALINIILDVTEISTKTSSSISIIFRKYA